MAELEAQAPSSGSLSPQPSQLALWMAAATMHQLDRLPQNDQMPMLRDIPEGQRGSPAELYNAHRNSGLDKDEASKATMENLRKSNPDLSDDELAHVLGPGS